MVCAVIFTVKASSPQGGLAHLPNTPCVYILIHLPCGHLKLTLYGTFSNGEIMSFYESSLLSKSAADI